MADRIQTASRGGQIAGLALAAIAAATAIVRPAEGEVRHSYPDVVLGWAKTTACDGHTGTFHGVALAPGQVFTAAECQEMLSADLRKTWDAEAACMPMERLNQNQAGAILDLGFNIGAGDVCSSSIPGKVRAGQYAAACATIAQFDHAGGKDCHDAANHCAGIITRRSHETALCMRQS